MTSFFNPRLNQSGQDQPTLAQASNPAQPTFNLPAVAALVSVLAAVVFFTGFRSSDAGDLCWELVAKNTCPTDLIKQSLCESGACTWDLIDPADPAKGYGTICSRSGNKFQTPLISSHNYRIEIPKSPDGLTNPYKDVVFCYQEKICERRCAIYAPAPGEIVAECYWSGYSMKESRISYVNPSTIPDKGRGEACVASEV